MRGGGRGPRSNWLVITGLFFTKRATKGPDHKAVLLHDQNRLAGMRKMPFKALDCVGLQMYNLQEYEERQQEQERSAAGK